MLEGGQPARSAGARGARGRGWELAGGVPWALPATEPSSARVVEHGRGWFGRSWIPPSLGERHPAPATPGAWGGGAWCSPHGEGSRPPRHGRLSQAFLTPWRTLLLTAPPVTLPQPPASAPLYCKNHDSEWGAGGTPARPAPQPAPGGAMRPAPASRAPPAAPSAGPAAASPARRCPPATACKERGLRGGHWPGSTVGGGAGCPGRRGARGHLAC